MRNLFDYFLGIFKYCKTERLEEVKENINILDIPLNKTLEDFSDEEKKDITEAITIRCPEIKKVKEKYFVPFKEELYDYPEINRLEIEDAKNLVFDIYDDFISYNSNNENDIKKRCDIKQKYAYINSVVLEHIHNVEQSRLMSYFHRYKAFNDLAIYWYIWKTSKNCKYYESHKIMDNVLICFPFIPNINKIGKIHTVYNYPYWAGEIPYCHCNGINHFMTVDEIFSHNRKYRKVYWNDKIHKYSKEEFIAFIKANKLEYTFLWDTKTFPDNEKNFADWHKTKLK